MIYLDVTSACQSGLNNRSQTMQRGLHACLMGAGNCQPVCWQSARRGYRTLRGRDRENLAGTAVKIRGRRRPCSIALRPDWFPTGLHFARDAGPMLDWPEDLQGQRCHPCTGLAVG